MIKQRTLEEKAPEVSTTQARQATGPRAMLTVLAMSMLLAAAAGTALLAYFLS